MDSETKICQNCKNSFIVEPDDFAFYQKMKVPPPTFCPECRSQRRLAWRNDITLYNDTCKSCNKNIISLFNPSKEMNVFCTKCWWSDSWNPYSYGTDYDFSKDFFTQFTNLIKRVPVLALVNDNGIGSVNSEYTHDFSFAKNCYMTFVAWKVEDVMYTYYAVGGKNLCDCLHMLNGGDWCYENIYTEQCYKCLWAYHSKACSDCMFIYDCRNCTDCFMCTGLRNKRYCFKNKQYSEDEYKKIVSAYKTYTYSGFLKAEEEFESLLKTQIRRFTFNSQCVGCTGDMLFNGKDSKDCFNIQRPENCRWVINADTPKDSYDLSTGGELSFCYEGITCDHSYKNLFAVFSWKDQEVEYTHHCHSSKHLFGCAGIRNGEYSILNKRYTKEEYFDLLYKIKEQMSAVPYTDKNGCIYKYGEFLPSELSYFGYNETLASQEYPLEKMQALQNGYNWEENLQRTTGKQTIKPEAIPESVHDVSSSFCSEILECRECKRNYKITDKELEFYKRLLIPIPRNCFHCRLRLRVKKRNPYKLWTRSCMCNQENHFHGDQKCEIEFKTSYAPDRPEVIYCEKCYQQEVS